MRGIRWIKKISVIILLLLLINRAILADEKEKEHPIDVWSEKCMKNAKSDEDMVKCAVKELELWDKELNKLYEELINKLEPKQKNALKTSQRKWIEFRNIEFKFIDALYDLPGLLNVVYRYGWKVEIIRERALKLQRYLNDTK